VYQFPWYGIQGEGGYYDLGQGLVYPGIDLVKFSEARSVVLWGATLPLIAGDEDEIRSPYDYDGLHCTEVKEVTKLGVAQEYIKNEGYGSDFTAIIKVKTGQSDGSNELCEISEGVWKMPNWSHICTGSWELNQLISASPNDLDEDNCCTGQEDPLPEAPWWFSPPPDNPVHYSENIYDYTSTLIKGCRTEYNNKNYSFENECDLKWAGLGIDDCPPDGPYTRDSFDELEIDPEETARHLAHHYMQSYFSFAQAVNDAEEPDCLGYPFGISNLNLGLLIGRWLADEVSVEAAMRFTNTFFAEVRRDVIKVGLGMENAYPNGPSDKPWPGGPGFTPEQKRKWKLDFGISVPNYEPNKLAVFHATFLETFFEYVKNDVNEEYETRYFDGLVFQYYSHWSCIDTTLMYLNDLRDGMKPGTGVADLPVVIDELGNRQRLYNFDPAAQCYVCDKDLEYETGWSRNRMSGTPDIDSELAFTQASEAARKLIRCSAPNTDGSGNNIRGVMWEWMMKPRDCTTDKCEIVQGCGRSLQLPGYRFPSFTAYKFFVHIINRLLITPTVLEYISSNGYLTMARADFHGTGGDVTAYWGFYRDDVYEETISPQIAVPITRPSTSTADVVYIYNAVGESLGDMPVVNGMVNVDLSTSPRYLSWGEEVEGWPPGPDPVEDYSHIAFNLNKSNVKPWVWIRNFDTIEEIKELQENEWEGTSELRGLAWMTSMDRLLVSVNGPDYRIIDSFNSYTYSGKDSLDVTSQFDEIGSIATRFMNIDGEQTEVLHVLVKIGSSDYKVVTYCHDKDNGWILKPGKTVEIDETALLSGEMPEQLRVAPYWEDNDGEGKSKFIETLYLSTNTRILYVNKIDDPDLFVDFTAPDASCEYNGFGFALDGHLYISNDLSNDPEIRKYEIDWTTQPSQDPFSTWSAAVAFGSSESPRGMRISPFGTLVVSVTTGTGFKVLEYVRDAEGKWDTISPRILEDEPSATGWVPGDMEFTYNR